MTAPSSYRGLPFALYFVFKKQHEAFMCHHERFVQSTWQICPAFILFPKIPLQLIVGHCFRPIFSAQVNDPAAFMQITISNTTAISVDSNEPITTLRNTVEMPHSTGIFRTPLFGKRYKIQSVVCTYWLSNNAVFSTPNRYCLPLIRCQVGMRIKHPVHAHAPANHLAEIRVQNPVTHTCPSKNNCIPSGSGSQKANPASSNHDTSAASVAHMGRHNLPSASNTEPNRVRENTSAPRPSLRSATKRVPRAGISAKRQRVSRAVVVVTPTPTAYPSGNAVQPQ
nr:MAG TPA: hypothetical protein [Caudoviricetes sp.]